MAASTEVLHMVLRRAINPALRLLPAEMTSDDARTNLLAIGLQESGFETRVQYGDGPARGFWQFEEGTEASRGGVYGIYLHDASKGPLEYVCQRRQVIFDPHEIWETLEFDDILAASCARLLMWTDPYAVPVEEDPAWSMYCDRCWRPGKPHPDTWSDYWMQAGIAMDTYPIPSVRA
jgi:hypothetical protein